MKLLGLFAALLLAGCGQLQNVTVSELRTPENLRKEGTINLSIAQIQQSLYDYGKSCRPLSPLVINPSDPTRATYIVTMMGWSKASAAQVVDLREAAPGRTEYQAYTYYKPLNDHLDELITSMSDPTICSK